LKAEHVNAKAERPHADAQHQTRHRARELALQMLYQWEVARLPIRDVLVTFWLQEQPDALGPTDDARAFAERLAVGVADEVAALDPMISEAADNWRLERMNVIDRLILRVAVFEFLHETETPSRVVINEALELARTFSGEDAVRFTNGVLDAIRRRLERT
jgi:N utilization substance protein B